ncbi:butyrophilin subfamily 1 member A1 isoform X6 [Chelonia mydas]|uniref:butyrophilin subfamily 1 member A1 isoform X6 n=1 Tax=Chelonia mydas TaxID=8469 RepID=UPI001CA9450F|nr:butyrophilin subfamily 1 member A1 isoform X6 [Chelonia mydas]
MRAGHALKTVKLLGRTNQMLSFCFSPALRCTTQAMAKMKISSFCCSSRTSSAQMGLIIFPIICHIQKLESAQFAVVVPDHSVTAIVGEEFVLPCHLSPRMNAQNMEVKWLRPHLSSIVHLYRDGKDQNESQTLEYQGRTELLKDGLSTGSVDLKIHNIRPSDEGLYRCFIRSSTFYRGALLELKVAGLGSDPHLSVEGYQDGGIQVVCRSAGWYPEPEVLWRDLGGRHLPSVSETTSRRDNGLFETQTAFLITERSNQNLSCCIRNTFLNQEKESTIYVAEKLVAELTNVTLDPDTAHPRLIISEDRKSVRQGDTQKDLPDNPERFDYECCVLGCEGFISGIHYWEVEAGDGKYWAVGVARESVSRKGEFMSNLNPEVGIWAVRLYGGQYQVLTSPKIPLTLRHGPSRIRVCLDYEQGQVAFFDADNQAPIFTFPPASFTGERIRPWLWVRGGSQLSLCH